MHLPRRWWPLYLGWIALCAILFVTLSGLEDPSRPTGRILSIEAGQRALNLARARGLRQHHVVHVARARKGEGGNADRWIVLSTASRIRASRKRWWWSWGWRMGGCWGCGNRSGNHPNRR